MPASFLLSRVLLRLNSKSKDLMNDISAIAHTPDGSLWIASDELISIERLSPVKPYVYGKRESFAIADFIDIFNSDDEVDIEGMDYENGYLWFTGSHGTKRNKPKGKNQGKDIKRLAEIKTDLNRYLLARIPVINGKLVKSCTLSDDPEEKLTAACLEKNEDRNILIEMLKEDPHLAPFLSISLPSKDNGFDIEGLAVRGDKIFLGLRGPVLRGWAILLEIEVEEKQPGVLSLNKIGESEQCYKKHFLDLNGQGIREICFYGDDLLVLAGPTMDVEGSMTVFRLQNILDASENTLSSLNSENLEVLFDLPFIPGSDHAEGLTLFPCLEQPASLLVVYDSPHVSRKLTEKEIFADVFQVNFVKKD